MTAREGKLGKSRLLPLHPTAARALQRYQRHRDRVLSAKARAGGVLFPSSSGRPMDYSGVRRAFPKITDEAGVTARSASCWPRIHDLRHSFAVATLLDACRRGDDVQAVLPRLSTYLGHVKPRHTYWYLTAAPDLLALAAERLERRQTDGDAA